ncbi:MAG: hypothetical protein WCV92_05215 [Candidatus Buchananbacteria bacterium]
MALYFKTNVPEKLLAEFKKAIKEGRITTWSCDPDGDFTHSPDQWKNQAWFRPKADADQLVLYILKPKNINLTTEIYAVYHGRFIESMLVHCDKLFTDSIATALPAEGDNISQD